MDVSEIISVLSDHGFADTGTPRMMAAINDVYWDTCAREPWPFLEKSFSLTFDGTNANPSNYPTDVATVTHIVDTVNGQRLYPMRLDELRTTYSTILTKADIPQFYYFIGSQLYVYPVPAASQTLLLAYLQFPAELTDVSTENNIVLPARFHSILWNGALFQLYDMEDDPELASKFENRYERKIELMRNQVWLRQADRYDTIEIIDREDRWS